LVRFALAAVLLANAVIARPANAGEAGPWRDYVNDKYAYAICYPANWLRPQGESDAGDGQAFLGDGGVKLIVYGVYDVEGVGLSARMKSDKSNLVGPSGMVSYETIKATWYVISGTNDNGIFYHKTITADEDRMISFALTYPSALRGAYDRVAEKLSRCLKVLQR